MKTPTWESSPGALLTFVNAATRMLMADLYTITLVDGTVYRVISAEVPLTIAGNTFVVGPKIERSKIRQAVGITVDSLTVDIFAEDTVLFGTIPLIQAFARGMMDNARVMVERAYINSDSVAPVGTLIRFVGRVGQVMTERGHAQLEVRSDLDLLNVMIPAAVYQPSCRNTLYDLNCGVDRSSLVLTRTVSAGSTGSRLTFSVPTSGMPAPDYLSLGVATITSGVNAGASRTIKRHTTSGANSIIEVIQPWAAAVSIGDQVSLAPGCDKLQGTCDTKFSNLARFSGEPYVPLPDLIV